MFARYFSCSSFLHLCTAHPIRSVSFHIIWNALKCDKKLNAKRFLLSTLCIGGLANYSDYMNKSMACIWCTFQSSKTVYFTLKNVFYLCEVSDILQVCFGAVEEAVIRSRVLVVRDLIVPPLTPYPDNVCPCSRHLIQTRVNVHSCSQTILTSSVVHYYMIMNKTSVDSVYNYL